MVHLTSGSFGLQFFFWISFAMGAAKLSFCTLPQPAVKADSPKWLEHMEVMGEL